MTKLATKVVCDAGPLIHLQELNCLDLLADFSEIILPSSVYEEIKKHQPSAVDQKNLPFKISSKTPDEELLAICRAFALDVGETEALALIKDTPEAIFLTDDASARVVAQQMGFKVHGTVGILVRSIRRGLRKPEEVIRTIADIPLNSTLYIKQSLLDEIIFEIKIEFRL